MYRRIKDKGFAIATAEKVRHALSLSFNLDNRHVTTLSASIGITIYPEHGTNGIELTRKADNAMYQVTKAATA